MQLLPNQPTEPTGTGSTGGFFVNLSDGTYQSVIDANGNIMFSSNCVTSAPGLQIVGGSGSALVNNKNTFSMRVSDTFGVPVSATATFPVLDGGNLAFDNGTVPATTNSCRMYTFFCDVNKTTGATTLSVAFGADFPKHRPATVSDVNLGDGTKAIVGYLYVKNESSAVFIPGTTHLDATGITSAFNDAFGYLVL